MINFFILVSLEVDVSGLSWIFNWVGEIMCYPLSRLSFLGIIKVGDKIFLDFVYIFVCWYFYLPCSFQAMEPYGGDCLVLIFCLWNVLLNKELRTRSTLSNFKLFRLIFNCSWKVSLKFSHTSLPTS